MNRSEQARQLHKCGCNCCQAVVLAYADKLGIDVETAKKMSSPFGRGLSGLREVCGCVSGMALVCGLTDNAEFVKGLAEKFRASNGEIVCGKLLQLGKKPCGDMVAEAAALLEDVVD